MDGCPVAVKIQKQGEPVEVAKRKLIQASKSKNCRLRILIKTQPEPDKALFIWNDENVLIIDAHDLQIKNWLAERQEKAKIP